MSNYYASTRTNYFRVTNEEEFKKIMRLMSCFEDSVRSWTKNIDGELYYAFGTNDDISGVCNCNHCQAVMKGEIEFDKEECEEEASYNKMCELLQAVINSEDAVIIVSSGHDKLRFVGGCSTIITSKEIIHKDIWENAINTVKELLSNENYDTTYSY